jgi:hypothetical protein
MGTYSDYEQRQLDQQTGEEMDRHAQRLEAKASNERLSDADLQKVLDADWACLRRSYDSLDEAAPWLRRHILAVQELKERRATETPATLTCLHGASLSEACEVGSCDSGQRLIRWPSQVKTRGES